MADGLPGPAAGLGSGPRHVLLTLLALTVFLGIYWIVNGAIEIFTA